MGWLPERSDEDLVDGLIALLARDKENKTQGYSLTKSRLKETNIVESEYFKVLPSYKKMEIRDALEIQRVKKLLPKGSFHNMTLIELLLTKKF